VNSAHSLWSVTLQCSVVAAASSCSDIRYFVGLQAPYSQEIQQEAQPESQVVVGYMPPVRPPYGGATQQTLVSGSYEQHRAAAGVHQSTGGALSEHQMHSGQQMAAHRPVYVSTGPSVMPQAQPLSASYSQPPVSSHLSHIVSVTLFQVVSDTFNKYASYPDWRISRHANHQSLRNTNSLQHWPSPTMRWPVSHTTHGLWLSSKFVARGY